MVDNTRPVRTNTADRAPCMHMAQGYVRILVCTVCFQWDIHTNRVHSSAHRVVTTHYGAGGYLNNNPNYELLKKWWTTRAPYAPTLQTVRHACSWHRGTCAYLFARFVLSTVFFWIGTKIQKNPEKGTPKYCRRRKNNYFWWSIFLYPSINGAVMEIVRAQYLVGNLQRQFTDKSQWAHN